MSRTTAHLAAAATALFALFALSAEAGTPVETTEPPTMRVWYGDLDLTTAEGNAALSRRLAQAARAVCPQILDKDLAAFSRSRTCQANAIRQAVRAINNPMLARLAIGHGISND